MRKKPTSTPPSEPQGAASEDSRRPEKVMVPFFQGDEAPPEPPLKGNKIHPTRRHRLSKSEAPPPNRSLSSKKQRPAPAPTKEIGLNPAPLRPRAPSPSLNSRKKFDESYDDIPEKIAYIDTANVGNIRPLSMVYRGTSDRDEPPPDVFADFNRGFRPSFSCQLDEPSEPRLSFVDALIRNSNTFEDVVVNEPSLKSPDKSEQLKSVLTKMGILDRSTRPPEPPAFKGLERQLDKRYVFPKYMSSPDPSSLPMPRSL